MYRLRDWTRHDAGVRWEEGRTFNVPVFIFIYTAKRESTKARVWHEAHAAQDTIHYLFLANSRPASCGENIHLT